MYFARELLVFAGPVLPADDGVGWPGYEKGGNRVLLCGGCLWVISSSAGSSQSQISYQVRQLTSGPSHHFYGYIGHVGNSPYSADGRHLIALRTTFQDHMPGPQDVADIVLLDVEKNYAETRVEATRGWNPQQGAMMYWNPNNPRGIFFFTTATRKQQVFTASTTSRKKRVKEFRFDQPVREWRM